MCKLAFCSFNRKQKEINTMIFSEGLFWCSLGETITEEIWKMESWGGVQRHTGVQAALHWVAIRSRKVYSRQKVKANNWQQFDHFYSKHGIDRTGTDNNTGGKLFRSSTTLFTRILQSKSTLFSGDWKVLRQNRCHSCSWVEATTKQHRSTRTTIFGLGFYKKTATQFLPQSPVTRK